MQINGAAVATIRERSGLTQTALSKATGTLSQGRISEIESAESIAVRPATGIALADALGCPLAALVVPAKPEAAA